MKNMQNFLGCKTKKKSSLVCHCFNKNMQNFMGFKTEKSNLVCYCLHAEFSGLQDLKIKNKKKNSVLCVIA